MLKVNVVSGDISKVKSDSMITAINSSGMWFGGIDGVIRRTKGNIFHSSLASKGNLVEGVSYFIPGTSSHDSFENVIFVIDNLKLRLHEIVLSGLNSAERNQQEKITLPTIRMGVMLGVVEKNEDEAIDEMVEGVEMFKKQTPFFVKEIKFVVYNNPELVEKLRKRFNTTESEYSPDNGIRTISESKSMNRLPENGTLCKITSKILPQKECGGFFVKEKHIECRKPSINGIYRGWVPGAGGDIWWIEHEDGTVGAYTYEEVIDRD